MLLNAQDGVPNLYEGDMSVEEEVLDWLIEMKVSIFHLLGLTLTLLAEVGIANFFLVR